MVLGKRKATTVLDVAGVVCVLAFLFFVWPPLPLLGLGAALLLVSWVAEGRSR